MLDNGGRSLPEPDDCRVWGFPGGPDASNPEPEDVRLATDGPEPTDVASWQ